MKTLLFAFSCILFGLSASPAQAEDLTLGVTAHNAYAYATSSVQKNGAVFVELTNIADGDIKIAGAKADVSERVELHTHIMEGDVMMMREVEGYDVPAGGSVTLEPMGHHIMLMNLNAPLVAGESFPMSVMDEHGMGMTFNVEIKNPGAPMEKPVEHSMDKAEHDSPEETLEAPEAAH